MKLLSHDSPYGLLSLLLVSVLLMVSYTYSDAVRRVAGVISVISAPVHLLASSPIVIYRWLDGSFESTATLEQDLVELNQRHLVLQTRLHRFKALEAENQRLRKLLGAVSDVSHHIQLAELLEVDSNTVLINRGTADGVTPGLPVIDEGGVVGQVTRPGLFRSAVTLVTDPSQGVPVQAVRSNLRTITFGAGRDGQMRVFYVDRNADIRIGDLLVTSGLGGTYPAGYPVANVSQIQRNVNEPFMTVWAIPAAHLDKGTKVMLIFTDQSSAERNPGSGSDSAGDSERD